jgi:hypothetical protein
MQDAGATLYIHHTWATNLHVPYIEVLHKYEQLYAHCKLSLTSLCESVLPRISLSLGHSSSSSSQLKLSSSNSTYGNQIDAVSTSE